MSKEIDELRKNLEVAETLADMVSDDHPHPCPHGEVARAIRDASRGLQKQLLATSSGPAQVSNANYRANWDSIFGMRQTIGEA